VTSALLLTALLLAGAVPPPNRTDEAIRLSRARAEASPRDVSALVALAGALVEKGRETGDSAWYDRATDAASRALAIEPESYGALVARGRAGIARHAFALAAVDARRAAVLRPELPEAHAVLGDVLVNTGDVDGAGRAYERLGALAPGFNAEVRLATLEELRGDTAQAGSRLERALVAGLRRGLPAESLAWARTVLADLLVTQGELARAEALYREALEARPATVGALAGLGRVRASRGDLDGAARSLAAAARLAPFPAVLSALGDVQRLRGDEDDARRQHGLIEAIARLRLDAFGRDLALYYADHDLEPAEAVGLARRELAVRRDVHTYDVLSWALYKADRLEEAGEASCEALRLGTRDPRFLYHAGMIARAIGERARATALLCDALALNPSFDVVQARVARRLLDAERPIPCPASRSDAGPPP